MGATRFEIENKWGAKKLVVHFSDGRRVVFHPNGVVMNQSDIGYITVQTNYGRKLARYRVRETVGTDFCHSPLTWSAVGRYWRQAYEFLELAWRNRAWTTTDNDLIFAWFLVSGSLSDACRLENQR